MEEEVTCLMQHQSVDVNPPSGINLSVYKRRFVVLGIISSLTFLQCLQWNTWGPISESAIKVFFGWSSSTVALLGGWGCLMFITFIIPMCYLIQERGLRCGIVTCAFLVAAGTAIRCATIEPPIFTILCHLSAICIGIAGTLMLAAPPLLASHWFPAGERTTATAFCQAMNQLGNAGSYLEPLIVSSPSDASDAVIIREIQTLLRIGAIVMTVLLITILIWFPSRPPTPPSHSSTVQRFSFIPTIKYLLKKRDIIIMLLSYSMSTGVSCACMSVLNFPLSGLNISQKEAMHIGIISVLVSCCLTISVGNLTDRFYGHIRKSILFFIGMSFLSFVWLSLLCSKIIPSSKWQIYSSVIIGLSCSFAVSPLYFELAVEMAYPSPEHIVGGLFAAGNNLVGASFLLLFLIPATGYAWVTYCLVGGMFSSFIAFLFIEEQYRRSAVDYVPSSLLGSQSSYQSIT